MTKRLAMVLGLMALAGVLVAASAQAGHKTHKVTNLTFAGWSSGPDEDALDQQMANKFNATHKGIHVTWTVINGSYPQAMTARFAAHNAPDVFYVDSGVIGAWIKQGVIAPLNGLVKSTHFNTKPFYPKLLAAFKKGKKIYGFPKDWSPLAMEINKGMLGAAHATVPKNWAQLRAAAQKIQSSGVLPSGAKPICLSADWARMLPFVFQNGASLATITSPAAAAAVNFYVGLIKSGLADTPDKLGSGWCGEALGKQKAAIIFEGNWLLPFMQSTYPGIQYGVFPMVSQKTGGNLAFTVSYSIAKSSSHKQAAWTLLSWLTSQQGQKLWVSKGLALPSRSDVKAIGGRKNFLIAAKYAHGWGFNNFANAYTIMNNDLSAVITGSKTVQQMLSDTAAAIKG